MEADAPVDEVDALATRIEEIDEPGEGNDEFGLGAVLKKLIRNADVEGVQAHLELLDYHDEAVHTYHLAMAARLPHRVHYGDAAVHERSREVLLRLVVACSEQTLGQCIVHTDDWNPEQALGRRGPEWPRLNFNSRWEAIPDTVTLLHQFAWDGDVDAVAMILALPQCSARLVNVTAGTRVNHDGSTPLERVRGGLRELTDEMGPGATPLHIACVAGRTSVVQLLLRDGRADPNYPDHGGNVPLITATAASVLFHRKWDHHVAECVRKLTRDPRVKVDIWYTKTGNEYAGASVRCHILSRLAKYGALEMAYHVLAALPKLDPHSVKIRDPLNPRLGLDALSPIEQCLCGSSKGIRVDTHHPMLCFLIEVSNAGGFKKWRAQKTLDLMVLRALVTRARKRRRVRAAASMTTVVHRLFNMRDDAVFLRVLEFCWFLNPGARAPCAHDYELTRLLKEGKTNDEAADIISKMGGKYQRGTYTVDPGPPTESFISSPAD
jgi:hypothetical protein